MEEMKIINFGKGPKMNLLIQTIDALHENDKTSADVAWVGTEDGEYTCNWSEFSLMAENIKEWKCNYNIVVVGFDWWLERYDDDYGSGWEYKSLPGFMGNNKLNEKELASI